MSVPSPAHLGDWTYVFVFGVVALQSAGVPLPGTTALIAASLYAGSSHEISIVGVIAAGLLGAVSGNALGFGAGWWGGWGLLKRHGWRVGLSEARMKVGRYAFASHGGKVVFFSRFVTGARTWCAFLAGANRMGVGRFMAYSSLAAIVWSVGTGVQYYFFGHLLDAVGTVLGVLIILAAVALTVAGAAYLRRRGRGIQLAAELAHPGPLE